MSTLVDKEKREALMGQWLAGKSQAELVLHPIAAGFATLMSSGYLSPHTTFMHKQEIDSVVNNFEDGRKMFCPVPILNIANSNECKNISEGDLVLLRDPNIEDNPPLGIQRVHTVELIEADILRSWARALFATDSMEHPGVARFLSQGQALISGELYSFNHSYYPHDFPDTFRTASQLREEINRRGWKNAVAFQTRNPMHRAHEELCKIAMQECDADGLIIHMLLGKLKQGDIPADVRDEAIRSVVKNYFPKDKVLVSGYGFDMLYAGPREALLHAVMRQNMGVSHMIVGRDHAGVGSYYSAFAAQDIFDQQVPPGAFEINIFKADHTAWSKKLNKVVMFKDVTDHAPSDFIQLSGTKVREMLAQGMGLPEEFTRPEVAQILEKYYKSIL